MSAKKFAVVFFEEDKSFSEIPTCWINEDMKTCKWPKSLNPTTLMVRGVQPTDEWDNYKIRVDHFYDTLETARKHAENDYTSSEEVEKGRGKRKKRSFTKCISTDDDDEESISDSPPPNLRKKRYSPGFHRRGNGSFIDARGDLQLSSQTEPIESTTSTSDPIIIRTIEDTSDVVTPLENSMVLDFGDSTLRELNLVNNCNHKSDFDKIHTNIKKIFLQLKCMESRMICLANNQSASNKIPRNIEHIQSKLPLNTIEELLTFENFLEEEEEFSTFISFLQTIGGKNGKDALVNMLRKIFTNTLATGCSWHGLRGNFKLCHLKLMNSIKVAEQRMYTTIQEHEIIVVINDWFRQAKLREAREKK